MKSTSVVILPFCHVIPAPMKGLGHSHCAIVKIAVSGIRECYVWIVYFYNLHTFWTVDRLDSIRLGQVNFAAQTWNCEVVQLLLQCRFAWSLIAYCRHHVVLLYSGLNDEYIRLTRSRHLRLLASFLHLLVFYNRILNFRPVRTCIHDSK